MKESLYSKLLNLFQLDSYFCQGALVGLKQKLSQKWLQT